MHNNWYYIKIGLLIGVLSFLFAFANVRNAKRKISKPQVTFTGAQNYFITVDDVSKLLIHKLGANGILDKEAINLNVLESTLNANPMVRNAEVYLTVNGTLTAKVEQKMPIARISTSDSYYLDSDGKIMPLSNNFTARVPLVTGSVEKNKLNEVYKVASKIQNDEFLKTHVIEIYQNANNVIFLKLRKHDFLVQLGNASSLDKKINNLKAFYKNGLKQNILDNYSKINLQFDKQVVCTKI